jgi:hypothetical protein
MHHLEKAAQKMLCLQTVGNLNGDRRDGEKTAANVQSKVKLS